MTPPMFMNESCVISGLLRVSRAQLPLTLDNSFVFVRGPVSKMLHWIVHMAAV